MSYCFDTVEVRISQCSEVTASGMSDSGECDTDHVLVAMGYLCVMVLHYMD